MLRRMQMMNLLLNREAGQPRGDCPYLKNLDSVGAGRTGRSPKSQLPQEFYLRKVRCMKKMECFALHLFYGLGHFRLKKSALIQPLYSLALNLVVKYQISP
jgi:hypothetical protein